MRGSWTLSGTRASRAGVIEPRQSWRVFAVMLAVLALLYVALDLSVNGALATWTFQLAVVQPVEKAYGFDAEWEEVGGMAHLVVQRVVPGGGFDRARIRPGYAFAPARCSWFALGGGWYALLSTASGSTSVELQTVPGVRTSETSFTVAR